MDSYKRAGRRRVDNDRITESPWCRRISTELRQKNAKVIAIVAHQMQEPGIADRYVAHLLFAGWLEFKGPKTHVKLVQRIFLREMCERGVPACLVQANEATLGSAGKILRWDGEWLGTFDGTGENLLAELNKVRAPILDQ